MKALLACAPDLLVELSRFVGVVMRPGTQNRPAPKAVQTSSVADATVPQETMSAQMGPSASRISQAVADADTPQVEADESLSSPRKQKSLSRDEPAPATVPASADKESRVSNMPTILPTDTPLLGGSLDAAADNADSPQVAGITESNAGKRKAASQKESAVEAVATPAGQKLFLNDPASAQTGPLFGGHSQAANPIVHPSPISNARKRKVTSPTVSSISATTLPVEDSSVPGVTMPTQTSPLLPSRGLQVVNAQPDASHHEAGIYTTSARKRKATSQDCQAPSANGELSGTMQMPPAQRLPPSSSNDVQTATADTDASTGEATITSAQERKAAATNAPTRETVITIATEDTPPPTDARMSSKSPRNADVSQMAASLLTPNPRKRTMAISEVFAMISPSVSVCPSLYQLRLIPLRLLRKSQISEANTSNH